MPTYEYECNACEHRFEQFQRMSDPAVRKCPKCAKLKVRRLISGGAGVIFKGSGFYETDYKRARRGGSSGARKDEGSSASEKSSESTSDAKPAAKPDSKSDAKRDPKPAKKDSGSSS